MAQSFNCPSCGAPLDIEKDSGATMRCPYCNASVIVPEMLRTTQTAGDFSSNPDVANTMAHVKELAEIARLVKSGKKIEAIKLYRQITDVGLLEAKTAVEAMERGEPIQITGKVIGDTSQLTGAFSSNPDVANSMVHAKELAEIVRLAKSNNKIEAIKLYRQVTGSSLLEAKEAVEAMERGEPIQLTQKVTYHTTQTTHINSQQSAPPTAARRRTSPGIYILAFFLLLLGLIIWINLIRRPPNSSSPAATPREQAGQVGVFTEVATLKAEAGALLEPTRSYGNATLLLSFGAKGIGQGQLQDARSIAVDSDGAIYTAEYQGGRVEVFDPEGKFANQWNTGDRKSALLGLMVSSQDIVSVAQAGNLLLFNGQTGEPVKQI